MTITKNFFYFLSYPYSIFSLRRNGTLVTTGGAQGLFEIPTTKYSRAVKTHSGNPGDPIWKYNDMDVKAFLAELRQAGGKAPRK